ncbi:amidohydrolase, partial [Streptomyces violascens]
PGTHYPHRPPTWPHSREARLNTVQKIPVSERSSIQGVAAAEVFGFDTAKLAPIARRIGPTPAELGQPDDQLSIEASWARSREVGRHWLTEHDFPVLGVSR